MGSNTFHEQTTLDRFFVRATDIATTDWDLMEARLDRAAKYDSEFRNFPRGKRLTKHIFDTIRKHPGITTRELIGIVEVPKTTVYDHVKYLTENERSVRKIKGELYTIGSPPKVLAECGYHNITVLFLVQHQVGELNELCQFMNKSDLFKGRKRRAIVWPPQRKWRPIRKSCSIKVSCTKDPLNYEEMKHLRSLIWKFFGEKKRLRFNLERNIDVEDYRSRKEHIQSTTITEEGRFIRRYAKRIDERRVIRTEVSAEGEFEDVLYELEEKLEMEQLWDRLRSRDRIIEELKKKNYKMLLDVEQLQEENHDLREVLSKLNFGRKKKK
jgi:hypothetical protein